MQHGADLPPLNLPSLSQVEDEDVARARNQLKASILFSQDGTTGEAPHRSLVFWCTAAGAGRACGMQGGRMSCLHS